MEGLASSTLAAFIIKLEILAKGVSLISASARQISYYTVGTVVRLVMYKICTRILCVLYSCTSVYE